MEDAIRQKDFRAIESLTRTAAPQRMDVRSSRAIRFGAVALGACALGATAFGALAIGRLAIGALAMRRGHVHSLTIDNLDVRRLHVGEIVIEPAL